MEISAANAWVRIFIEIMQMGVSVAIMQVEFSIVRYADAYFYVIMQVPVSIVAMYVTASSSRFLFLSLADIYF